MTPPTATARRFPASDALALSAGLCTIVAWYLPWFSMQFSDTSLFAGMPSQPMAIGPYAVASQDAHSQSVWVLLLAGMALIALGLRPIFAQRHGTSRRDALWLTLAACALALTFYFALNIMAVPQTIAGGAAPGVYLVPEPGALVMLAGIGAAFAACLKAWRFAGN